MAYQKLGSFDDAYIKETSPGSYQQIQAAKSAWEAANAAGDRAGMDAAHQAAESIRAAYGYSGLRVNNNIPTADQNKHYSQYPSYGL